MIVFGAIAALLSLACGTYVASQVLPVRATQRRERAVAATEAARDRVRRDPVDFTRSFMARLAPKRLGLERTASAARVIVDRAEQDEARILTGFKGGAEPSYRKVVVIYILTVLWIASMTAAAVIDYPIIKSVSGGSALFGLLGTILALCGPAIASLFLAELWTKHREGEMPVIAFALSATGLLILFVGLVSILSALAPIRAEVEYADAIRITNQQITQFKEDNDATALDFAEQHLAELQAQQERSAEWNKVLVPIAAGTEFATGFFAPSAILLLKIRGARRAKDGALDVVRKAGDAIDAQRADEYRSLTERFAEADVPQLALQHAIANINAENYAAQQGTMQGAMRNLATEFGALHPEDEPSATEDEPGDEDEVAGASAPEPEHEPGCVLPGQDPRPAAPATDAPLARPSDSPPPPAPQAGPDPSFDLS